MTQSPSQKPSRKRARNRATLAVQPQDAATAPHAADANEAAHGSTSREYSEELAFQIVDRLADGERLKDVLRELQVPKTTCWRWRRRHPAFREAFDDARKEGVLSWLDDLIEIADDDSGDWIEEIGKDGKPFTRFNREAVERAKVRIDARKWAMAKTLPAIFGDTTRVDLSVNVRNLAGELEAGRRRALEARTIAQVIEHDDDAFH